jgi:putative ABC transport system substrate-binding protein
MNRRTFLVAGARLGASVGGLALLSGCDRPSSTEARRARIPRIGFLLTAGSTQNLDAFREGLRQLGWIEGQNIGFEVREGDANALAAFGVALVDLPVDVIVTGGSTPALAIKRATSTIPLVMAGVQEPVSLGLVASLAHPGGNVTGLSRLTTQLAAKRLELLKEVVPGLARVAVIWDSSPGAALNLSETQAAAQELGLQVQALAVKSSAADELEAAFAAASRDRAQALIFHGALFQANRARIAVLASSARIPSMHADRGYVQAGGLMSYGENLPDLYLRAAAYVDKILRGAKPADLPVEQPTKFELVVNLKTAQTLGLTIPPSIASRVTEWIS